MRCSELPPGSIGWIEIEPVAGQPDHIGGVGRVSGLKQAEGRYTLEVRSGGMSGAMSQTAARAEDSKSPRAKMPSCHIRPSMFPRPALWKSP
jgi:hypothetical protein